MPFFFFKPEEKKIPFTEMGKTADEECLEGKIQELFCLCPLDMPARCVSGEGGETGSSKLVLLAENLPVSAQGS